MKRPDIRPKLVALDLDGTLLTTEKRVSPRTLSAVKSLTEAGVRVVVCTGRPPRTVRELAAELSLGEYAIVYNGAAVYDFTKDHAVQHFDFAAEVARAAVVRMRRDYPGVTCGLETAYGWFVDSGRAEVLRRGLHPYETEPDGVGDILEFMERQVTKLLFWHAATPSRVMSASLAGLPVHTTWSFAGLLEVTGEGVNKKRGLEWVTTELGLDAHEVAAFGDEDNDKEMLAWAGLGVAMGNAAPEVKAVADVETLSNDDDGVAVMLEQWL